jgi:hypothetical protein
MDYTSSKSNQKIDKTSQQDASKIYDVFISSSNDANINNNQQNKSNPSNSIHCKDRGIQLNKKENFELVKYLMIDHGGVLEGEYSVDQPLENDLLVKVIDETDFMILKNGVNIIKNLNHLVDYHNCMVVFHSKNKLQDQLNIMHYLQSACKNKGLVFPKIKYLAVRDSIEYKDTGSTKPKLTTYMDKDDNNNIISIAGYGDELDGKECLRNAISVLLNIETNSRGMHYVIDDGPSVVQKAILDGWNGYIVGDISLDTIISEIREKIEN